jgi:UDP-N-acetylmuramoylalanine--D-glutamate ligase
VCQLGEIGLRGEHNVLNVLAAVTLADCAGIDAASMRRAIVSFRGVAHRLEVVATVGGVTYVNDSIATAPERSLAGMAAFEEPLVLLAGGQDKDMDWERWARTVAARARHVVLFGELAPFLETMLREQPARTAQVTRVETLTQAVDKAAEVSQPGDVALLSPGGTSYDAFRDFEERGALFRSLVWALESAPVREGR